MPQEITIILGRVAGGENLSVDEMSAAIDAIMRGEWTDDEIGLLLDGSGCQGRNGRRSRRRRPGHATPHDADPQPPRAKSSTRAARAAAAPTMFNVSTTAAIVAAAAGVPVAKHGNRSITSRSGSADVLAELGVNINASVPQVEACLDELGLCFCFAPLDAPGDEARRGRAQEARHSHDLQRAGAAGEPGRSVLISYSAPADPNYGRCWPVRWHAWAHAGHLSSRGEDGLGDVTLSGITYVTEVITQPSRRRENGRDDGQRDFTWQPVDFGISPASVDSLTVDGPTQSAAIIRNILTGTPDRHVTS